MLDCRDYDMAVVARIRSYFCNTHFIMQPTMPIQELRDRKLLEGKDVEFPLITVRRTNCPIISKDYNSWSRARTGYPYSTSDNMDVAIGDNLFKYDPVLASAIVESGHRDSVTVVNSTFDLTYYIDVLSFERDNFDTIMIELQENLLKVPYIGFCNIKSDGSIDRLVEGQSCHLLLEEVEDTSDLDNFSSGNSLYRATITTRLNAYIYRKYKSLAVEKFNVALNVVPGYMLDSASYSDTSLPGKSTTDISIPDKDKDNVVPDSVLSALGKFNGE